MFKKLIEMGRSNVENNDKIVNKDYLTKKERYE